MAREQNILSTVYFVLCFAYACCRYRASGRLMDTCAWQLMLCIHTYCAKIYGHPPDSSPRISVQLGLILHLVTSYEIDDTC
ncbi:hypothetical protein M432DRAFT_76371 [Thermoascus aurantiacus ATCC 26904]